MGVRIISDKSAAALYDSTTGYAFGPIFDDEWEAEDFLDWLKNDWRKNEKAKALIPPRYGAADARSWSPAHLALLQRYFREEREEGPEPDGVRQEGGTIVPTSR